MPENVVIPELEAGTVIDADWLTANKPALGEPWPAPPDSAVMIQLYLVANWIQPSQLIPREKWPHQKVGLVPLYEITLEHFKELAAAQRASKEGAEQGTTA